MPISTRLSVAFLRDRINQSKFDELGYSAIMKTLATSHPRHALVKNPL